MQKNAICTFVDRSAENYFSMVEPRMRKYAEKIGAGFIIQKVDTIKLELPVFYVRKYSALVEVVNQGYEKVAFIDADNVPKDLPNPPNIFDEYDDANCEIQLFAMNNKFGYKSLDKIKKDFPEYPLTNYFDTGVVLMRCESVQPMIEKIKELASVRRKDWSEQTYTNAAAWKLSWTIQALSRRWNGYCFPDVSKARKPKFIFMHAVGKNKVKKIEMIIEQYESIGV